MQTTSKYNNIPAKEALKIPELKDMAEAMLKNSGNTRRQVLASEKYLKASELATRFLLMELLQKHPDWQLKDIFVAAIQTFPAEMPPQVLLKMTQIIVEEWEKVKLEDAVTA